MSLTKKELSTIYDLVTSNINLLSSAFNKLKEQRQTGQFLDSIQSECKELNVVQNKIAEMAKKLETKKKK